MRKFLLFVIATMMSVAMMAAGGDGSSKANAIDFDWVDGHEHVGTAWYRVDLSEINGLVDPTLALYLTNLADESVKVNVEEVSATISVSLPGGFGFSKDTTMSGGEYTIGARDYKLWSQNVKMLLELNVRYLHLKLNAEQKIMLSAKKYETSDIVDIACEDADDFDWSGVQVEAGEKWYRLNLAAVKAQNKKLNFVVANQGSEDATVTFDLSLDCPASVVFGYNWTIPAGGEMTEEFGRVFIDELKEDYVYLKLNTNQALNLRVEEVPAPAPKDETWVVADVLTEGQAYTFSGEHIFEVPMATLSAPRGMKAEFVITNNSNEDATLTKQISFANPVKTTIDKELTVAANATVTKEVVNNMAGVINSQTAYIRFDATQELTVQLNYVVVNEEVMNAKPVEIATCEKSQLLDWNSSIKQSGLETKWYEIDLSTIKQNDEHLQLTFTNKSNNIVVVMGEILRACEGDTLPYICPVPAGMSVSQVINYNMFALLQYPDHFYISATVIPTTATSIMEFKDVRTREDLMKFVPKDLNTIQDAEVELTANTISALVDPNACNQATTIARGVKYEQAAGTTKWYRVTDELLNKLSLLPDVAFINNGKQAANLTLAASVDCEHSTFGMSTFTLPTWADLTVFPIRLLGDLMDKDLNQDVTEVYLQVTTDQPIAFGVDIDYGFGLGCDDAREFDWTKGAVIEKGDAQWLSFDISSVKQNKQQVKLTLTNESNSIAWVGMMVSLTCPFDVALPMVFPIPAGASVDKVVDYSYFAATKLDQLYIALITEEKISLKAVAEEATASPMDKLACENAIEVESGETYENKGTQWYKFSGQLFSDMSRLPRFMFATPEGKTKVTVGATVGCEYNIATRVTLPLPGNLDLSFRFPSRIFDLIRKFVHQDVTEVYLEMTTDKKLVWSIDMTYVDACETAIELDFSKPIKLDLKANEDVWYKVDVNSIKGLKNKNLELALYNNNDKAVDIEVEVSPTCPVVVSASKTKSIAAYDSLVYTVPTSQVLAIHDRLLEAYPILKGLSENLVYYVRVRANGDLTVNTDTVTPPPTPEGCENAQLLDWTKTINLSELHTGWYKFDISSIHANKKDFTLSLNNDMGEKKNLGFTFYQDCDTYLFGPLVLSFPVGITEQTIPYSMMTLLGGMDMLYVYLELDAKLPCEDAILFDWNKGAYQEANKTQWYEFDITPVLEQEKQVKLTFTNHSNENAWVIAELAFHCPYTKSIPIIVPVPANMSVDKWIDYSAFEASRIEHFYLGVTTREAAIELAATWEDARVTPSDGCLNATLVENEVLYEHAAGTHWYKFTGDLFEGEGSFSRVHVINRSAKTVNITAGGTVGCEYNIATRTNFKLPRRFDLAFAIPVWVVEQMKKFIDDDVTEFYLELTTDQPIAFSFGMDACEEAIPFDWTTGHTQEALTTQWYNVDIAPVLANEQQIKLTFTNHSDQTAWVGTLVSLNCPFKVALPLAFPIPAGMSVDKVIDYSYFAATRLDQLYVGVTTDSKISVIAEAQSAIAHPNDKAACATAKTLKVDENNIHPAGTAWYKVDGSLFADMERLPKFRFETVSGETTTVTIGATVGCDYNIATRGTVKMPGGLDMYLRAPRFIFSVIEKFIDDDVNEFYVELTTDKDVEFTIFADHDEDLTACSSATDFVLSDSMTISLEADKDVWYKVDMKALKANDQDWSISVVNPSDKAVDVEVEVSPTCPMVASAMKEFTVPASVNVATVITSEQIATNIAKFPNLIYYVRVRATEDLTIEVTEPEVVEDVEACYEAIDYIYGTDIILNGESDVWYKLNIKDLRDKDEIITLTVTNNSTDTAKATLDIYDTCPVEYPILSMKDVVVDPLQVISREVAADELPGDVDSIYLHVRAIGALTVNLSTKEEPQPEHVFAYDTIAQYYCPADLPLVTSWNDTVKVTELLDSVYTYNAKELIAPVALTMQEVSDILGTNFSLVAGTTPDMSASVADIKTHYATIDNEQTADVVNVSWTVTSIPCGATSDTLTLLVTDECDNVVSAQYVFDIVSQTVTTIEETITICSHELPYEWNSMQYTAAGTHTTTKTNIYGCDSAKYILHLNVLPEIPVTNVYDTVCYGESYTWNVNNQTYDATGQYSVTLVSSTNCDSVVTLNLTVLPDVVTQEENVTICHGETYTWPVSNKEYKRNGKYTWRVKSAQGCDSVNHILNLTVLPAVEKQALVTAHICYGEKYDWRGKQYTVAGIYGDTLRNVAGCDSVIYTLNLTASAAPIDSMTRVMLCAGDSYKWDVNGQSYMYPDQGTYNDTYVIKDQYDCDSIICELELVVSDGLYPYSETVCYGESYDLIVDGITHTFNTSGTHVVRSQNGCQVTLFLTVLDEILPTDIYQTICYGESYDWEHDTFTQLGDYTKTLISSLGCDSVVTLHLTVLPEVVGQTEHKTVCFGETYEWHQVTYSASGTYTASLQDNNGCTYTDTLILTILDEVPETKVDKYLCEGDSMLWDGQYIKQSGLYPVTLQDSHGCDSLVTLNLTFVQGSDSTIYKTICSGGTYVFQNQTLTQSGTYVDTIAECNTTITLHLTVNQAITVEVTEVVNGCAYDWNGVTYTTSGDYTYKTTGINGCDSTTILHLTLVPTVVNAPVDTVTLCYGGTHPWRDGETYSTAGTYTYVEKNANDCDSTRYTLELIVREKVEPTIIEQTICYEDKSYTWDVTGLTYDTTGYYKQTLTDVNGCDSIVTLHLVVFDEILPTSFRDTINEGDSYTWNGKTYTTAGDYIDTIPSTITGCDSIVTLSLHVIPQKRIEVANITAYVCDGTEYIDPVTNKKHIITSLIPSTQTWSDTIVKSLVLDSIYNYVITPIVAPEVMTDATLASIAVAPVLTQGVLPDMSGTVAAIMAYYNGNDTEAIADVNNIYWTDASLNTVVPCGATTHTMTLVVEAGCDNKITTTHTFDVLPVMGVTETVVACDSYTWNGQTYTTSGDYTFTGQTASGCDSIVTLHLTINKPAYTEIYETTCDSYDWYTGTLTESGVYVHTLQTTAGCDSIVTLRLTINKSFYKEETATACDSYTWSVDGKTYTTSGDYTFNGQTAAGCDSIVTLHLTINNSVQVEETVVACDFYTWNGKTYTTSGDYTFNGQTAAGCDSVAILHLTILPDVVYEPAETDYLCPASTYEWRNHTYDAPGTYYDTVYYSLGCDSVIYTLELLQYVNTLPAITADDIVAVCGEAVNVQEADAIIRAHISNEALYAPNADVKWYVLSGNTYEELTNTAIDGTVTEVTLKYTVTTDCGVVESDPIVVTVVPNSPEHDDTLADIPAYNKYGGRLLTVDVKYIRETFGLEVTEDEVTWYLENGDNDIEQGKGYYLTTEDGTPLPAGQYYALINYQGKSNVECDIILQTITLVVETQVGPMLLPTVAKPDELIRVLNLDSDATSTITIYSSTGQQLDSFQVKDAKETSFNAAHVAGYYIVEVQTESDKVSLRYVVK